MRFHCQYRLSLPSLIQSQGEGSKNNIKSTNGFVRHSASHTESLKNSDFLPEQHKSCSSESSGWAGVGKKKRFLDSHRYRRSDELRNKGWNFKLGGAIASISFRRPTRDQNNRDGVTLRHVTTRSVTSHGERLGESHLQRVEAAPGTIRQPADRPSGRRINWSDTSNDSTPSGGARGRGAASEKRARARPDERQEASRPRPLMPATNRAP